MMLEKAIRIAAAAHAGQLDKGGNPYILHPLRVMLAMTNDTDRICAVLHDVLEDSEVAPDDLRDEGFPEAIIDAVCSLTKRSGETYDDFIGRVLQNDTACRVKLADLVDNTDLARIPDPSAEDVARIEKYQNAIKRIKECMRL